MSRTIIASGHTLELGDVGNTFSDPETSIARALEILVSQQEISMNHPGCRNIANKQGSATIAMSDFYGRTAYRDVSYLVIGGGGGGGAGMGGGGGGGGSHSYGILSAAAGVWTITVGAGGANCTGYSSANTAGGESSLVPSTAWYYDLFLGPSGGGGGRGGAGSANGGNGSNGGGAGSVWAGEGSNTYLGGTASDGYSGGMTTPTYRDRGAGGGGRGSVGASPTSTRAGGGGSGIQTSTYLALYGSANYLVCGGGGGGGYSSYSGGLASYGGGAGGGSGGYNGTAGTANRGGGGGATAVPSAGQNPLTSGAGGSGAVWLRYSIAYPAAIATTGSPTYQTDASYRYYTFYASGTITFQW